MPPLPHPSSAPLLPTQAQAQRVAALKVANHGFSRGPRYGSAMSMASSSGPPPTHLGSMTSLHQAEQAHQPPLSLPAGSSSAQLLPRASVAQLLPSHGTGRLHRVSSTKSIGVGSRGATPGDSKSGTPNSSPRKAAAAAARLGSTVSVAVSSEAAEARAVDAAIQAPLVEPVLAVLPVLAPAATASTGASSGGGIVATLSRALLPGAELVAVAWSAQSLHRDPVTCMALLPEDGGAGSGYLDAHRLRYVPGGAAAAAAAAAHPPRRWMPPCLATAGYDCTVRVVQRQDGRPLGSLTVETTVTTGAIVQAGPSAAVAAAAAAVRAGATPASPKAVAGGAGAGGGPTATVTRGRHWQVPIDAVVLHERRAGAWRERGGEAYNRTIRKGR